MALECDAMQTRIGDGIESSVASLKLLLSQKAHIGAICQGIIDVLQHGGRVFTAGNGGSAAEAMHMAEELVGRYKGNRRSLPGIALTADGTAMTCIGNDFGFDQVFSRQVEGLASPGDILVLFSTSGNARNLLHAYNMAQSKGVKTVCILGRDGGALAGKADFELCVQGHETARIQEAHQVVLHLILEEIERVFSNPS